MDMLTELQARRAEFDPAYLGHIADAARQLDRTGMLRGAKRHGERAPDFALPGPDGRQIALSELLRRGPVVISFYRGEWCPFCRTELTALLSEQPRMDALGATLLLISPEAPSRCLVAEVARLSGRCYLLQDRGLGVALLYGLAYRIPSQLRRFYRDKRTELSRTLNASEWLLPLPADYLIDPDGMLSLSYVEADFTQRLDPKIIVEVLENR